MDELRTYHKGDKVDIAIDVTFVGKDGQLLPPSSLIDYSIVIYGLDDAEKFNGLTFERIADPQNEPEHSIKVVDDEAAEVVITLPKEEVENLRAGDYYLKFYPTLDTSQDPEYSVDQYRDVSDEPVLIFKVRDYGSC